MRRRYVFVDGEMIEVTREYAEPVAPMVMPDIKPYRSMADGSIVESRRQHREMLKRNGCFEVGSEAIPTAPCGIPDVDPAHRKEIIAAQIRELGHEGFKRAVKKDVDFIKWNSNGLPRSE